MNETTKRKEAFAIELVEFYREYLGQLGYSINRLSSIQKEFPDEYKVIREFQSDPMSVLALMETLDQKSKDVLYDLFMRQSLLTRKISNLFDMSVEAQVTLSKEIEDFSEKMKNNIQQLKIKKEVTN